MLTVGRRNRHSECEPALRVTHTWAVLFPCLDRIGRELRAAIQPAREE